MQITFSKFREKLPLFWKCPCLLFSKQRRNSWLKLTQMLLWRCDELSLWSIIYVPEEIKLEHLCANPEAISSRTQSLAEVVNTPYPLSTLKRTLPLRKLELLRHIKKISSLAECWKSSWYLEMLNISLDRKWILGTLIF